MAVTIEFYSIPRQRAGTASVETPAGPLRTVLRSAGERLPDFGRACLDGDRLKPGYVANLNGRRFVSDPQAALADGDSLLIFSADVGG